jgi:RecB family endonuclease NucS
MYRREDFRHWFAGRGYKPNTVAAHISTLNGIDRAFGLDETLSKLGIDGILKWAQEEQTGPFENYPSNTRSALNRYVEFTVAAQSPDTQEEIIEDDGELAPVLFQVEKEMQAAVRKQLQFLEDGLVVDDGGKEMVVTTGKIDIVARDKDKKLVVIELKAGLCPAGAIEQVLGYAEALSEERKEPVRAYLIAGEFSDRTRAAARRVNDLQLKSYEFTVKFNSVAELKS